MASIASGARPRYRVEMTAALRAAVRRGVRSLGASLLVLALGACSRRTSPVVRGDAPADAPAEASATVQPSAPKSAVSTKLTGTVIRALASDGSNLYGVADGDVVSVAKVGGATKVLAKAGPPPIGLRGRALAVSPTDVVWWSNPPTPTKGLATLWAVAKSGGVARKLFETDEGAASVAEHGGEIYVSTDLPCVSGGPPTGALRVIGVGGAVRTVAKGSAAQAFFADDSVYWASLDSACVVLGGAIRRREVKGGPITTVYEGMAPHGLSLGGDHFAIVQADRFSARRVVYEVPRRGGEASLVAEGDGLELAATDASWVYAYVGDALVAHSWDGKTRRVVLPAVAPRGELLIDGVRLWLATGEGIFRLDP